MADESEERQYPFTKPEKKKPAVTHSQLSFNSLPAQVNYISTFGNPTASGSIKKYTARLLSEDLNGNRELSSYTKKQFTQLRKLCDNNKVSPVSLKTIMDEIERCLGVDALYSPSVEKLESMQRDWFALRFGDYLGFKLRPQDSDERRNILRLRYRCHDSALRFAQERQPPIGTGAPTSSKSSPPVAPSMPVASSSCQPAVLSPLQSLVASSEPIVSPSRQPVVASPVPQPTVASSPIQSRVALPYPVASSSRKPVVALPLCQPVVASSPLKSPVAPIQPDVSSSRQPTVASSSRRPVVALPLFPPAVASSRLKSPMPVSQPDASSSRQQTVPSSSRHPATSSSWRQPSEAPSSLKDLVASSKPDNPSSYHPTAAPSPSPLFLFNPPPGMPTSDSLAEDIFERSSWDHIHYILTREAATVREWRQRRALLPNYLRCLPPGPPDPNTPRQTGPITPLSSYLHRIAQLTLDTRDTGSYPYNQDYRHVLSPDVDSIADIRAIIADYIVIRNARHQQGQRWMKPAELASQGMWYDLAGRLAGDLWMARHRGFPHVLEIDGWGKILEVVTGMASQWFDHFILDGDTGRLMTYVVKGSEPVETEVEVEETEVEETVDGGKQKEKMDKGRGKKRMRG